MKLVLVALDLDKKFRVKINALNYTIDRVLSMRYTDKLQRPIAFIFKLLSDIEYNYKIYDKKMLAIVKCLEM